MQLGLMQADLAVPFFRVAKRPMISRQELWLQINWMTTVKLGNKERFDKEQIGIKELCMDYQPFYTINLLLDKELLPV